MNRCRVALVAFASRFGEPERNLPGIVHWVQEASKRGCDLVCFPEMALQGYYTDASWTQQQAESIDGRACRLLTEIARACRLVISLGMALRADERTYNAQVFVDGEGVLGFATKVHLGLQEVQQYVSGDVWPVIDLGFARLGTLICFDAEFPEGARCLALEGAEIILMSFATGRCDSCGRPQDSRHWANQVRAWAPSRGYDNRVFVLGVNHAGDVKDGKGITGESWASAEMAHRWPGYCFAYGPDGVLLAESATDDNGEHMLVVDLEPELLRRWRVGSGNFLSQRRPETYDRIVQRDDRRPVHR